MNLIEMMGNPRSQQIKKVMYEILKERYGNNEQIIERISTCLTTDYDMQSFFKIVTDIYEKAYMKAVNDHKDQLKKLGLSARIVDPSDYPSKDG
jgi:hypothetical protein